MWINNRREFLARFGGGFGAVAAACLLERDGFGAVSNPLAARPSHFPAKAKAVIHLFMQGGPSQMDTFDPKPILTRLNGQTAPASVLGDGDTFLQFTKLKEAPLLAPKAQFSKRGQSGLDISNLFENVAQFADELVVIRSCHHDSFTHGPAVQALNSGVIRLGHPSMGAWLLYGLGSISENLPGYMVIVTDGSITAGPPAYGAGFLPAVYQGTLLRRKGAPILNVQSAEDLGSGSQREMIDLVNWHNEHHRSSRQHDTELSARISSYELAFRMQTAVPELADLSKETEATRKLYGMDDLAYGALWP